MRRKSALSTGLTAIIIGLITITQTLSRPRLSAVHTVDVISLIAAGACFGAGITALVAAWRTRQHAL